MNKITSKNKPISKPQDNNVVNDIVNIIHSAKTYALFDLNTILIKRNWLIGKRIYDIWLNDKQYGKQLIKQLAQDLKPYGRGFSTRRLYEYLNFYKKFTKIFRNSGKSNKNILRNSAKFNDMNLWKTEEDAVVLTWSHYVLLSSLDNQNEITWYEKQAKTCNWNYLQLKRNIKTDYYHRVLSNQIEHKTSEIVTINQNDYL